MVIPRTEKQKVGDQCRSMNQMAEACHVGQAGPFRRLLRAS